MREPAELDAEAILAVLIEHGVDFVVVGGFAAVLHGAPTTTFDLDVTPSDDRENLARLCVALEELDARLWPPGAGEPVEWPWNPDSFSAFTTLTTVTKFGGLDIVLRPDAPNGKTFRYGELAQKAIVIELPLAVPVAALDDVIASKEAANREKDRLVLPLLRALRERLDGEGP